MQGTLTRVPDRVFVLMVGGRYYGTPTTTDQAGYIRVFMNAESAGFYKNEMEPFMGSALEVIEKDLAEVLSIVKECADFKGCELLLSHCDENDDAYDIEVLWDPAATKH